MAPLRQTLLALAALLAGVALGLGTLLAAPGAAAEQGERAFQLSASALAGEGLLAPTLGGGWRMAWTDYIELGGELGAGLELTGDASTPIARVLLEARYLLDALTWVPWLAAGATFTTPVDGFDARWGGWAGVGLDYRPRRERSYGIALRAHRDLASGFALGELAVIVSLYREDR